MVGITPEGPVNPQQMAEITSEQLAQRVEALPGIDRLRQATAHVNAHLVGGSVRDLLLGAERTDIDVVIEGPVAEVAQRLKGPLRSHERFGTASVELAGLLLDLASARAVINPRPGALPEVGPASLADDLARRDFTINAMAWPLFGEPSLIDPHGGLSDLREEVLRVLHDRSFQDDPTRALRAARYAGRFGFALEEKTERLLRRADLGTVSSERVEAELRKLAAEPAPRRGFELAWSWGLLEPVAGGGELIETTASLCDREPWRTIADRAEAVLAAATDRWGDRVEDLAKSRPGRPSQAVAAARGHSGVELALARALGGAWLDDYVERLRHVRLEITGSDLLAAGVPEGPAIGRGLEAALRAKLDGEAAGREAELGLALAAAQDERVTGS